MSYLVEFVMRLKNFNKSQTFYSSWVSDDSVWGGGVRVEVCGLCVSVEVDLTPLPAPSAGGLC